MGQSPLCNRRCTSAIGVLCGLQTRGIQTQLSSSLLPASRTNKVFADRLQQKSYCFHYRSMRHPPEDNQQVERYEIKQQNFAAVVRVLAQVFGLHRVDGNALPVCLADGAGSINLLNRSQHSPPWHQAFHRRFTVSLYS